jgi:hypothetical protein
MGVVSSAVAAMDAHRGVAAVAEQGLGLLRNLSSAVASRVCAWLCSIDSGCCVLWGRTGCVTRLAGCAPCRGVLLCVRVAVSCCVYPGAGGVDGRGEQRSGSDGRAPRRGGSG